MCLSAVSASTLSWTLTATTFFCLPLLCAKAQPQPLSVTFGPNFLGDDGQWSATQIRVGSPEQWLLVFPSTTDSETWVVGPSGCDGTLTCQTLRGGLFEANESTTWRALGDFELGYSPLSETTSYGYYGFDTLAISDSAAAPTQVIAVVNDTWSWNGRLGLNPQETRFQSNVNHLSFISTLVQNESLIPSHSYGYTAGAYYESKGTLGSLTLGGVDTTRLTPNDVSFSLSTGYKPIVAVTSLTVSANSSGTSIPTGWSSNPLNLMPSNEAALFTVDSSSSFLWLPEAVCDQFAKALNLTYNETLQLYTFAEDNSPQSLSDLNLTFNFTFANSATSTTSVALTVSYQAFNQQLSYPFPGLFSTYSDAKVDYFPLRRTNSTNQYTIGRVLLQELYLTVDYERNNFSLSQALFPDSSTSSIFAPITRPSNSSWPGPNEQLSGASSHLSVGAKAGIGVAVALLVLAIAAACFYYIAIYKRRRTVRLDDKDLPRTGFFRRFARTPSEKTTSSTAELAADKYHPNEMVADTSNSRFELASVAPVEMPAAEVPPAFFAPQRNNPNVSQRNDHRSPVELVQPAPRHSTRQSIAKGDIDAYLSRNNQARDQDAAPAYTPTDENSHSNTSHLSTQQSQNSANVSPYDARANPSVLVGRNSDTGISPITGSGSGSERDQRSVAGGQSRPTSDSRQFLTPVSPIAENVAAGATVADRLSARSAESHSASNRTRSLTPDSTARRGTERPFSPAGQRVMSPSPNPRRTASTASRFKEDLPERGTIDADQNRDDDAESSAGHQSHSQAYSRFSWEE